MLRESSREALKDLPQLTINKQEKAILKYVMTRVDATRHEIANKLGMQTSTVAARINHMVAWGVLDEHAEKRKCRITGRTVYILSA